MTRPERIFPMCVLLAWSLCAMSQAPDVEESRPSALDWKTDPAWHQGKAEWALYDATRPVYGQPRAYEATIFTNKQRMDPETTTKASDWQDPRSIEVFKHNVSELIPTPNYVYRFLTTAFVRTDTLELFKLTASTQEDCGSTFKQFTQNQGTINEQSFSYFANEGERHVSFQAPDHLAFHDTLSLTLRDYPFQASIKPELELQLVPDQTSTHQTGATPAPARVRYVSLESISLPYGDLEAHHLVVEHETDGKSSQSEYWFASDPGMRHVMVKYEGPYGLRYELKRLDWWAYWSDPKPDPSNE